MNELEGHDVRTEGRQGSIPVSSLGPQKYVNPALDASYRGQ